MLRDCLLLLCLVAVSQQIKISNIDVPHAVRVGEDAELKCDLEGVESPGFILKWWWTSYEEYSVAKPIYQRIKNYEGHIFPNFRDHFSIKEGDTLELKNAQPKHSGEYRCHVSSYIPGDEDRKSDYLFVYTPGSGPLLNVTVEADRLDDNDTDDEVIARCQAFGVAPEPTLTIYGELNGEFDDIYENGTTLEDELYNVQKSVVLSNITNDVIYCKLSYLIFNATDADNSSFLANVTYFAPGTEVATGEGELSSSESSTSQAEPESDSSGALRVSWTLGIIAAAVALLQ